MSALRAQGECTEKAGTVSTKPSIGNDPQWGWFNNVFINIVELKFYPLSWHIGIGIWNWAAIV